MNFLRHHLRRCGGFALLATLMFALLPVVSGAMPGAEGGRPWTEVCSAAGRKLLAVAPLSNPDGPTGALRTDHCALCGSATGPVGLPTGAARPAMLPAGADAMPAGIVRAPALAFTWPPTQPRAPPRTA